MTLKVIVERKTEPPTFYTTGRGSWGDKVGVWVVVGVGVGVEVRVGVTVGVGDRYLFTDVWKMLRFCTLLHLFVLNCHRT